ncbi:MAG TPA: hypothetical protein VKS78_19020, partial [Roseiarcus sp.]|nr:hypothetical protein [Roseiarcus sp.]
EDLENSWIAPKEPLGQIFSLENPFRINGAASASSNFSKFLFGNVTLPIASHKGYPVEARYERLFLGMVW